MDVIEFLTAQLDEDELFARDATPGPWSPERPMLTDVVTSALLGRVADCSVGRDYRPQSLEDARHIARHDPARVLCEVAAKRAIVEAYRSARDDWTHFSQTESEHAREYALRGVVLELVSVYSDHPDFGKVEQP